MRYKPAHAAGPLQGAGQVGDPKECLLGDKQPVFNGELLATGFSVAEMMRWSVGLDPPVNLRPIILPRQS